MAHLPLLTPAPGRVWRRCCCCWWPRYWVLMGNIIKIHITRRGETRGAASLYQASSGKHPGIFTFSTSSGVQVNSSFGSSHSTVCYHDQLLSTLYRNCCVLCRSTEEQVVRCTQGAKKRGGVDLLNSFYPPQTPNLFHLPL